MNKIIYLEYFFFISFARGEHNPGTVDEEDAPHQGNVLPDFGLTCDRSDFTHFFGTQSVDDGRLPDIGVADEADGDLLLVGVELA